jgi:hypothetical protein
MAKQLKVIDEAFDMIKLLENKIGMKNLLPCVFNALSKD